MEPYFRDGGAVNVPAGSEAELISDISPTGNPLILMEFFVTPNNPTPLGTVLISLRINGVDAAPISRVAGWQESQTQGSKIPANQRVPGGGRWALVGINTGGVDFVIQATVKGRYTS